MYVPSLQKVPRLLINQSINQPTRPNQSPPAMLSPPPHIHHIHPNQTPIAPILPPLPYTTITPLSLSLSLCKKNRHPNNTVFFERPNWLQFTTCMYDLFFRPRSLFPQTALVPEARRQSRASLFSHFVRSFKLQRPQPPAASDHCSDCVHCRPAHSCKR